MAASHHHHHHHHHPNPTSTTTSCCCSYYSMCCTPPSPDPLQFVASRIHHPPPQPQPQPYLYSPYYLNPPNESFYHHQTPYYPPPTHQRKQQEFQHHHHHQQQQQTQPTISSLLGRIAALESSLRHQYSANSASSHSLRDAAARNIQTHFRAFLVRRSRTLRQLQDLASIKSTLNALKTAFSDKAHLDSQALSRGAMGLLLKLDSIQGGDPMIRDGKRSIIRDIIRFMEFIDGVSVKRNEVSNITLRNGGSGRTGNKSRVLYGAQKIGTADLGDKAGDERALIEKLGGGVEKIRGFSRVFEIDDEEKGIELENLRISINGKLCSSHNKNGGFVKRPGGVRAKVKKSVSFADNGNVSRVFLSTHDPIPSGDTNSSDGSGSIDDETDLVDNLHREADELRGLSKGSEDDEEADTEDGGSPHISDGERNPRRNLRAEGNDGITGQYRGEKGNFVFSAPLPVKMESRADLMKKRKAPKIVN